MIGVIDECRIDIIDGQIDDRDRWVDECTDIDW